MSPEDKEKQKRHDVQWVMSTTQGRRFVWELLTLCGVYRSLEGDKDSMLVQEGGRRIGLHLLGITSDASEDLVFTMMLEAKNRVIQEKKDEPTSDDTSTSYTTSRASDAEYDYATSGYDSGEPLSEYESGLGARFL